MTNDRDDRCQCRGQCGKHEARCPEMFGQLKLFERGKVKRKKALRKSRDKRDLCPACYETFDLYRAQREAREAQHA